MTEEIARDLAKAAHDNDCGDCPCPADLGGPGYCQDLEVYILSALRDSYARGRKDGIEEAAAIVHEESEDFFADEIEAKIRSLIAGTTSPSA